MRILHPLDPQKRPTFVRSVTPQLARRAERKCSIVDGGGAPTRVPKPSRSDQFYVPEFAELMFVVLVVQKGHGFGAPD